MESTQHLFGLLLAGGKGKRFWPLSREDHPKQLLQLFSSMTLIEETYQRIKPMVPLDRIMLATSQTLALRFRRLFNEVESDNFIIEPIPRNTAPCIGVAARRCLARDPDAILAVLPSDHYVADPTMFREILAAAVHHAAMGKIVTLGITPTHPETGYGYIRFGDFEPDPENPECRHRARSIGAFVEKPDPETAFAYLKTGRYLWNSGSFSYKVAGTAEDFQTSFKWMGIALMVSVLLVFMVMASQFESLREPFIIIFTVPLAAIGVVLMFVLTRSTIDVSALIGVIMLVGIVVNNGIIMVDAANQIREEGHGRLRAIALAGRQRLRPVLMTSFTTMLGMVPMALGIGEGAETWAGMGKAVIGGLFTSTFLTLFVVPVMYTVFARKELKHDKRIFTAGSEQGANRSEV